MNNAEIMSVARDKGFCHDELTPELLYCTPVSIERFATAIRDAALEEAARFCSCIAYSELLKKEVGECAVAAMRIRALKGTE